MCHLAKAKREGIKKDLTLNAVDECTAVSARRAMIYKSPAH